MDQKQFITNLNQKRQLINRFLNQLKRYYEDKQELIILDQIQKINNTSLKNFHLENYHLELENFILKDLESKNNNFQNFDFRDLEISKFRTVFKNFLQAKKDLKNRIQKQELNIFSQNPYFELVFEDYKNKGLISIPKKDLVEVFL